MPVRELKSDEDVLPVRELSAGESVIPIDAPAESGGDISLVKKAYDEVTKPIDSNYSYLQTVGDAASRMVAPKEQGTFPGRQINDFLATRGYPGTGAAIAAATETPGMAIRGAMGALDTVGSLAGIPYLGKVLNEGVQSIGQLIGLPDRVAGTMGTAANVGVNVSPLAPRGRRLAAC